jgi:hypothetical protein
VESVSGSGFSLVPAVKAALVIVSRSQNAVLSILTARCYHTKGDEALVDTWCRFLYFSSTEEIGVKCLYSGGDSLLDTGKLLASQVFLKGPRQMKITGHDIGVIVGEGEMFITSQLQHLGPRYFQIFALLKIYANNKQFVADDNMKQAVTSCIQRLDTKSPLLGKKDKRKVTCI